ncbi:MAG: HlyD family efflux transporter periplasmic adaptor subunit [Cellvibrio sp.]|uniref:efflux RND transporter periplasmic adaptor subunit n=1 Tax=Cellvibrio sp. TaxID=1965322 RepID=UPI0031AF111D
MNMKIADTSAQDLVLGQTSRKNRRIIIVGAVALLVGVAVAAFIYVADVSMSGLVMKRSAIRVATVERGTLVREVISQGRIVTANSPTLFSPEQGYIDIAVKAGDTVGRDQVLATIVSPDLNELLARETANLTRIGADLGRQKIESKRRKLELEQIIAMAQVSEKAMVREKLRADEAISKKLIRQLDYEKAEDDLERAALELTQAKQNGELAKESLGFDVESLTLQLKSQQLLVDALQRRVHELTIRSPVAGMVGNVQVVNKQAVAANQALITVVDLSAFEVEAVVPEGFADDMAPLMEAEITLGGSSYPGVVTAISPEVVNGGVSARIRFADVLPENLRQSQRLTAKIFLENKPNALIVNRGPFFDSFRGHVYRLQNNKALRVPVVLGGSSLKHIEIMDGLQEGDSIIISSLTTSTTDEQILITD